MAETAPAVDGERQKKKQPVWLWIFIFLLAAILLYFTLRGLDWDTFWQTAVHGRYEILLLTIPIASLNYFIRSIRWGVLVNAENKASAITVFWANMAGYLGNSFLPARVGELVRSAFLGRRTGAGMSFVLATALVERLLDLVALVIIGSTALLFQGGLTSILAGSLKLLIVAGLLGLAVVIIVPFQEQRVLALTSKLPFPGKIGPKVTEQIGRFILGMRSLHNFRRLVFFILLTAVIWLVDGWLNVIGVRIISHSLGLGQALIYLAGLGLSSAIPSTPGYVGVYQFVAVSILGPFGFSRADALAYSLIGQISNYLVISFWGLLGLWQINRSRV